MFNNKIKNVINKHEKVIIFGNTCSGKSTLILELNEDEFPAINNKSQLQKFLKSRKKFSTTFCGDEDEVKSIVAKLGINTESVGLIFAHPNFSYTKI